MSAVTPHPSGRRSQQVVAIPQGIVTDATVLDDHIQYLHNLIWRHSWSAETGAMLKGALGRIEERRRDPNLYLGVVGEFSSGKSTFLNAVMRDDLLRTDVVQATTAAVTWMRYGEDLDVHLEHLNGDRRVFSRTPGNLWQRLRDRLRPPDYDVYKERLRQYVHQVTSDEEVASDLRGVTIFHTSEAFRKGLVICDTPGANADNPRHVEVAGRVLVDQCDAAIVIIPADIPVSESLVRFLRHHVGDALHRCIYLVTKLDLIRRERERQALLSTIERRLKAALGLEQVLCLAAAPRVVVDSLSGERSYLSEKQSEQFVAQFDNVKRHIWVTLEANRKIIQLERISLLMSRLMSTLPELLGDLKRDYRMEHKALEKKRVPDLPRFTAQAREFHTAELRREHGEARPRAIQAVVDLREEMVLEVTDQILRRSPDVATLKTYLQRTLPAELKGYQERLGRNLATIVREVRQQCRQELGTFARTFHTNYPNLPPLSQEMLFDHGVPYRDIDQSMRALAQSVERDALGELRQFQDIATGLSFGGLSVGALAGTLVVPIGGTVAGAGVGYVAGLFMRPSFDALRQKVAAIVGQAITTAMDALTQPAAEAMDEALQEAITTVEGTVTRYLERYEVLVMEMLERDELRRTELDSLRVRVRQDIEHLEYRRHQIEQWRLALRAFSMQPAG